MPQLIANLHLAKKILVLKQNFTSHKKVLQQKCQVKSKTNSHHYKKDKATKSCKN